MHLVQVGETALGERAQQVQRRRALIVSLQHAFRVGDPGRGGRLRGMHDVAAEAGQFDAVDQLGIDRARLGELSGGARDLGHRAASGEGQNHGHLQQHAKGVAYLAGIETGERLGAIAALQQETATAGDRGQVLPKIANFLREHQRRQRAQAPFHVREPARIGVYGLLRYRQSPPAGG